MSNTRQIPDIVKRYLTDQNMNSLNALHDMLNSAVDKLLANPDDFDVIFNYMKTWNDALQSTVELAVNTYRAKIDRYNNFGRSLADTFCFFMRKPSFDDFCLAIYTYVLGDPQFTQKEQAALSKEPRLNKIDYKNHSIIFSDGLAINMKYEIYQTSETKLRSSYKKMFDLEMTRLANENISTHQRRKVRN